MEIRCKIGTHSSSILRVKGKRKLPERKDEIYGRTSDGKKWQRYLVNDYFTEDDGSRFYFLSL